MGKWARPASLKVSSPPEVAGGLKRDSKRGTSLLLDPPVLTFLFLHHPVMFHVAAPQPVWETIRKEHLAVLVLVLVLVLPLPCRGARSISFLSP